MVHMSRAYLTKKQMPQIFWYYAIKHMARMMNMIPGKYHRKLASLFMFVHGACPDPRTWLPLFLLCYFHHEKDSNASHSKSQAHTMDGIKLANLPPPMRSWSITHKINDTMNRTATELIRTAYRLWYIQPYDTMAASLSPFTAMIFQASANPIPLGCKFSTLTLPQDSPAPAL
jgi:hypothetical protein